MTTREELVQAVERSRRNFDAAWDAYMDASYDACAAGNAYPAWDAVKDAQDALKAYDKEKNT